MPELLLELFSEEIPARMQRRAADDLRRLVTDGLVAAGLTYEGAKAFATPRRLALTVHGVTARSASVREERKGPRVGAPPQAIEGFLRAAGLASIEDAEIHSDPKKGEFYVAVISKPGRAAEDIVAELVPEVIRTFPWPKSMRWGARSAPPDSPFANGNAEGTGSLRWVRPLRSVLCTFGPETEEPEVVPIEVAGIASGNTTYGHRFLAGPEPIRVRRFEDYVRALGAAKVVLDGEQRMAIIEAETQNLAFAQGLQLVEDRGLLEEVAGLVEWPVVLMGRFDERFLDIPEEVIRLTIRQNQKCFVLREAGQAASANLPLEGRSRAAEPLWEGVNPMPATPHSARPGEPGRLDLPLKGGDTDAGGRLTNRFVLVSNMEASDGGAAIVAGNERVIAARLADARFFWEQDKATPLEDWAKKLDGVTFHEKLGSQAERVERIARLARELAPSVGADPDDAERAARLAKADLVTGMVGEFPELQGVMGRYYALAQNGLLGAEASDNLPLEGRSRAAQPLREGGTGRAGPDTPHSVRPGEPGRLDLPLRGGDTGAGGAASEEDRLRAIADAIRDHYKPQGAADSVPTEPVSVAVALADKLDTLVGFWAIDEKPTGSKDPYALRRAALGVIRIILQIELRLELTREIRAAFRSLIDQRYWSKKLYGFDPSGSLIAFGFAEPAGIDFSYFMETRLYSVIGHNLDGDGEPREYLGLDTPLRAFEYRSENELISDLLAFFADRLKVHLREEGARHDLIDAVFAAGGRGSSSPGAGEADSRQRAGEGHRSETAQGPSPGSSLRSDSTSPVPGEERGAPSYAISPANDDLLMIVRRVNALGRFLEMEDGANLLVGYRRAANILRAEEKRDGRSYEDPPDPHLIEERGQPEERALFHALQAAGRSARAHVANEDFAAAMRALAELRPAVDAFFDKVTVNTEDQALRENRLKLLNMLREATLSVADFSKIAG